MKRSQIRWEKLDNTALLFPVIADKKTSNVYRVSVILSEPIDRECLQDALEKVLFQFDGFNVRLRQGIFWYYFEENGKKPPRVVEERTYPCRFIVQNATNSYLFRVTYYHCRINLEVFHALADGMGGMNFLKELTYQYLRMSHPEEFAGVPDMLSAGTSLCCEDSYLKNYRGGERQSYKGERAYLVKGERLTAGGLGIIQGNVSTKQMRQASKSYGITLNSYLTAVYIWSIYKEYISGTPGKKPVRMAVPVNLRPYFDSVTTRNFFTMISAEFMPEKADYTFDAVAAIVAESLEKQMNKENLLSKFTYTVSNQKKVLLRMIPLLIKNIGMRQVYTASALANTSTFTNVGKIDVKDIYQPYIRQFQAILPVSKGQDIKLAMCSYEDSMMLTFSSILKSTAIQKCFFRKLAQDGVDVIIESNGVYDA